MSWLFQLLVFTEGSLHSLRWCDDCGGQMSDAMPNRMHFFSHFTRAQSKEYHHCATGCCAEATWKWLQWRLSLTWLRMVADDVKLMNFCIHTAWQKASDFESWHRVVGTAMLQQGEWREREEKRCTLLCYWSVIHVNVIGQFQMCPNSSSKALLECNCIFCWSFLAAKVHSYNLDKQFD